MLEFAGLAEENADPLLGRVLSSLGEDCLWHRSWSRALVRTALEDAPELGEALLHGIKRWHEPVCAALAALEPLWTSAVRPWSRVQGELRADCARFWSSAGLGAGGPD